MKTWVVTLKITTKLLCLMQYQLDQQFCQELKEECFAEVAGKTMDDLIKVAYSFGDVKWAAHHILFMLPIFDALIEALYKIQEISFNTSKIIHKKVNDIFHKMVTVLYGVVETEHDIRRSEESVIHPATDVLLLVLEFFYRNRDMLEAVLGTQDYENDLHNHWISRLKKEVERIFKYEKDRQYIFILNNSWFLWQKTCDPKGLLSNEQVGRLCSLIQQYIKQYLDGYWVPLLTYLEVDSMRKLQHSSLDKFTAKFSSICKRQRQWPVITQLKMKLREEISKLIVPRYEIFFNALPANRSSAPWSWSMVSWKKEKKVDSMNTVHELDKEIRELFER